MIERVTLTSRIDGFALGALKAEPASAPIGGIVVIQEIFGLSDHIADLCTVFADAGYVAIAPGLFDRVEPNFSAGHDQDGVRKGIGAVMSSPWPQVVSDVQAAIDTLPQPVYVVGFCFGGAAAWMAAGQCTDIKAVSCFYGRLIADLRENTPNAPVMLHYGAHDASIPPANYERVQHAAPNAPLFIYDAGHGFCREGSGDFHAPSRELALSRTLDWFARWR